MVLSDKIEDIDVLVIGGGPAGATAAGVLARHGREVLLCEAERFPRHHVGESLQPASLRILDEHLGLGPALAAAGFARKYGALYVWGETREPWSVLFDARLDADLPHLDEAGLLAGGYEHAWQVDRATFDHLLLQGAARVGATVAEETAVTRLAVDGDRVVEAEIEGPGGRRRLRPRVVLDASGQRCVLGRALGLLRPVPDLQATATFSYFDGAGGVPGPLARHAQLVVTVPEGWIWFIPISATRTSVGVVCRARERLSLERFEQIVGAAGLPLAGARRVSEGPNEGLRFVRDWSYAMSRFVGENWALIGDAACFVDPILSGGVDFAIRGAAHAAMAVLQADGAELGAPGAEHEALLRREYQAYLSLARYWYGNNRSVDGFFWEAHRAVQAPAGSAPLRAFVYLTTGHYSVDRHFRVFADWQERRMFTALGADREAAAAALRRARARA